MHHAEFWSLIDEARATKDPAKTLEERLADMAGSEILDYDAWFRAYHAAVAREDLRAAVHLIRGGRGGSGGSDDSFEFDRAWLVGQGVEVVLAAVRDPETLAGRVGDHDPQDKSMLYVASRAYERATGAPLPEEPPTREIPDHASWPPSRIASGLEWTEAVLRELYPALHARYAAPRLGDRPPVVDRAIEPVLSARQARLAAARAEAALTEADDPETMSAGEREKRALELIARTRTIDERSQLELLNKAVALSPKAAVFLRGRLHVRLRNFDAALADFDAAIANTPKAAGAMFERAKLLFVRGERERALEDGRQAASLGIAEAQRWVLDNSRPVPPKRVRHATFGDGTVIAFEGSDQQTLVVEFAEGRKRLALRFIEILE